jgi:hypothetical protein
VKRYKHFPLLKRGFSYSNLNKTKAYRGLSHNVCHLPRDDPETGIRNRSVIKHVARNGALEENSTTLVCGHVLISTWSE